MLPLTKFALHIFVLSFVCMLNDLLQGQNQRRFNPFLMTNWMVYKKESNFINKSVKKIHSLNLFDEQKKNRNSI